MLMRTRSVLHSRKKESPGTCVFDATQVAENVHSQLTERTGHVEKMDQKVAALGNAVSGIQPQIEDSTELLGSYAEPLARFADPARRFPHLSLENLSTNLMRGSACKLLLQRE